MRAVSLLAVVLTASAVAFVQGEGVPQRSPRRVPRAHSITQSSGRLDLIPANQEPPAANRVSMSVEGNVRVIRANGIPDHPTGRFPNRNNPNEITEQAYLFKIPAHPEAKDGNDRSDQIISLGMHNFGIALNGIPFDPGAAEWYLGDRDRGWQYEALSGAIPLGLDGGLAHVQPSGAYHYHGLPTLLLAARNVGSASHSPLVGWAADGFPIYAMYGYTDASDVGAGVKLLQSSYQPKSGSRPSGEREPGGTYDGTFVSDYEFVDGLGDLDPCNGRVGITPEFPEGTYAYFLTKSWPVVPRCYKGTPSNDFTTRRGGPPGFRFRPRRPR